MIVGGQYTSFDFSDFPMVSIKKKLRIAEFGKKPGKIYSDLGKKDYVLYGDPTETKLESLAASPSPQNEDLVEENR